MTSWWPSTSPRLQALDQRFCAAPDGDFFKAIRSGRADVVTDQIDRVVPEGIKFEAGSCWRPTSWSPRPG